jgi:hypothetical protein
MYGFGSINNAHFECIGVGNGLRGKYYDNVWFLNSPVLTRVDPTINFQWGTGAITTYGVDYVSARWEGKIKPLYSEAYTIFAYADDGVRVWIDRRLIINKWDTCCNETWGTVLLSATTYHDIIVEYHELRGQATMELRYSSDNTPKQVCYIFLAFGFSSSCLAFDGWLPSCLFIGLSRSFQCQYCMHQLISKDHHLPI